MGVKQFADDIAKNKLPKMSFSTKVGIGFNAFMGYQDYKSARQEGSGVVSSLVKAGATYAAGEVLGLWMLPISLAPTLPGLAVDAIEGIGKYQRQMNLQGRRIPFANSTFADNQQAYTMRQAGMQIAQNSRYNLQQTMMGNEASYLR